jgi:hypothetical protein
MQILVIITISLELAFTLFHGRWGMPFDVEAVVVVIV